VRWRLLPRPIDSRGRQAEESGRVTIRFVGGLFNWPDYRALLDKAERDLASVQAHRDHPLDTVFNLVVTIDHIWDWVINDNELNAEVRNSARALRDTSSGGDPYVAAIHALSIGAKHLKPNNPAAKIETASYGWGTAPWGSSPWGGGYFADVDGALRDVADIGREALKAWRNVVG
jgi:hypothetical protein